MRSTLWLYIINISYFPITLNLAPAWLNKNQNCHSHINGSCYFFSRTKLNWFEGADYCKMHGGEIGKFNSEDEEEYHTKMFELRLPFWIGYHGHKYHGTKFVWSDGSADLYNKLNGESLRPGLSAGLCTLVTKSSLWNRAHCNETHIVLCRKPGKPLIFT